MFYAYLMSYFVFCDQLQTKEQSVFSTNNSVYIEVIESVTCKVFYTDSFLIVLLLYFLLMVVKAI